MATNTSVTLNITTEGDPLAGPAGAAQTSAGMSLETFLSSLAVAAAVFGAEVVIFVLLRTKLQRVYEPRTYLVPEKCVLRRIRYVFTSLTIIFIDVGRSRQNLDFWLGSSR